MRREREGRTRRRRLGRREEGREGGWEEELSWESELEWVIVFERFERRDAKEDFRERDLAGSEGGVEDEESDCWRSFGGPRTLTPETWRASYGREIVRAFWRAIYEVRVDDVRAGYGGLFDV